MAPVTSPALDNAVNETGQLISTILTFGLAAVVVLLVVRLCRRDHVVWPLFVLVAGTLTCVLEPLFDHLYGLWFPSEGQWTLFTTYGIHEPIWLAPAYLSVYGGGAVLVAKLLERTPTKQMVWRLYWLMVAIAMVAEIGYVQVLEVYNYQDSQPFEVLGYPLFLGFVNSMSALVAGIVIWRIVPLLKGINQLALIVISPLAFAVEAFGSGFFYLAVRHSGEEPSDVLLYVGALTVVLGTALSVRLLTLMLPDASLVARSAVAPDAAREPTSDRPLATVS
jgi:hypothetical protein